MNVKLKVLTAGVLFFTGQLVSAQEVKSDSLEQEKGVKEQKIEELVILGYGKKSTTTKSTTSSTTISAEKFENRPTTSFLNSIQGSAPGVSINSQSGSPGSGRINIQVRGQGSLSASTEPLYVIDGLMSTGTEYRNLNSNDIETLSILKDAQATAIYGNHGANGVVVITTKSGKFNSGLRISYDGTTSFSVLPKHKYDLMSSRELLLVQKRMGTGFGSTLTQAQIDNYDIDTNWEKEFFRTAFTQNHNLGLRYGGENVSGYTSLGYMDNEGILKNTGFKRFTFRTNIDGRSANRKLTYSAQVALGYSKRNELDSEANTNISNNIFQNPLLGITNGIPYISPFRGNGREMFNHYGRSLTSDGKSILILSDVVNGGVKKLYTQKTISVNGSVGYKITDDLTLSNRTGVNFKNNHFNFARDPHGYLSILVANTNNIEYGGWERVSDVDDTTINSVTSVTYDKKIGNHSITLGGYLDYLRGFYSSNYQEQNGLDPMSWSLGAGTGYIPFNPSTPNQYLPVVSASKVKAGTLAYIGTLEYDYNSKYGVSGTIRRDGSYRFTDENKWETFWSVGARWNIDKESFMEGSVFGLLKLRGSYGTNGNQNLVSPAAGVNPLYLAANLVRDTYSSETGYHAIPGYGVALTNPEVSWEKVTQANIGLDFNMFNRKIEGSVDVYDKKTSDMYLLIPMSAANRAYSIRGNGGEMRNRGVEASLRYTPFNGRDGEFKLSVFANFGYNKNKILNLQQEDLVTDRLVNAIGHTSSQWSLYKYVGVNPANGNYQFLDKNGNVTERPTNNDRTLTGKYAYAPYNGGFGLDVDYKGFYLTSLFSFQAGGYAYDAMHYWLNRVSFLSEGNGTREMLNAWTPTNTNTDIASLAATNVDLLYGSDKFLKKTDYIRLKNIAFGYNVPKELLEPLSIRGLKVYVMGENLLTFTNWKGFDPETALGTSLGVYPNIKTYSVGVNIDF